MAKIGSYRDLVAWQKAIEMVDLVYELTSKFPREETYGLRAQMRRAAVSVPSNIAEGYARGGLPEYRRYLHIARGSLYELQTQATISTRQGLLAPDDAKLLEEVSDELARILYGLADSLKNSFDH